MYSDPIPAGTSPPDTLCSREVTSSNWNIKQSVVVAAKLDFKYDGLQQRQMTIAIRKVDATSGLTIEKRTVATYTVISALNDFHKAVCYSNKLQIVIVCACVYRMQLLRHIDSQMERIKT
jgi:hypothetical protein